LKKPNVILNAKETEVHDGLFLQEEEEKEEEEREEALMGTPGRRRSLKALGAARRRNLRRVAQGKKPIVKGKKVALSTFAKKTGVTPKKARARLRKKKR